MGQAKLKAVKKVELIKLDLGCGMNKREGFSGIDIMRFDGVDKVLDLGKGPWPWETDSVDEIYSRHFVEHLTWQQRIIFFNEMWRVMKPDARALIITPNPAHDAYWGDPTHKEALSSWYTNYLDKNWREGVKDPETGKWQVLPNGAVLAPNAPHVGYTCDFFTVQGLGWDQSVMNRNDDFKMFAALHFRNSVFEFHMNMTARKPK